MPCWRVSSRREFGGTQGSSGVAAKHLEYGSEVVDVRHGRRVCGCARARHRLLHQFPCLIDVTEQPVRLRKVNRGHGAGIGAETELGVAIALGIINPQRLIEAGAASIKSLCQRIVRPKKRWATAASVGRPAFSASHRNAVAVSSAEFSSARSRWPAHCP